MVQNKEKEVSIEVEAITVAEAIKKALTTLHVKKRDVKIDVLKEEHKGLFGMEGAELAKIRVTLKEKEHPPAPLAS
jgi:predicted RNA-binding protein Jag